jgi:hypothetical protein
MSMTQLVALLIVALVNPTIAGTMFRLEVGPPIAAGTGTNFKNLKSKVVLVVRPRVCENTAGVQITGTAEGLVNGMRQSIALDLVSVNAAEGIRAIQQQWPDNGQWVLQLNGSCPYPKALASTLVPLSKSGFIREKTQVLTEPATHQQLEAVLAALVGSQS